MTHTKYLALLLCAFLSGCAISNIPSQSARITQANSIATPAGMQAVSFQTTNYRLAGYQKINAPMGPITVYIEGDGLAWRSKHRVSEDPTPTNPVALRLAALDSGQNILYLARPCQYVDLEQETHCDSSAWTTARLSQDILNAYNDVLNKVKQEQKTTGFHIVGYSGGGGVATLLAQQRQDILSLRTVAGLLDHAAFTAHHGVSALDGSLNPNDYRSNLLAVPQIHYVGDSDKIVPSFIAQNFVQGLQNQKCAQVIVAQNTSHEKGWEEFWSPRASTLPACFY